MEARAIALSSKYFCRRAEFFLFVQGFSSSSWSDWVNKKNFFTESRRKHFGEQKYSSSVQKHTGKLKTIRNNESTFQNNTHMNQLIIKKGKNWTFAMSIFSFGVLFQLKEQTGEDTFLNLTNGEEIQSETWFTVLCSIHFVYFMKINYKALRLDWWMLQFNITVCSLE